MAVLLATVAVAAVAGCGGASPLRDGARGSKLVTILQDDVHMGTDPVATLDIVRSLGATEVRMFMSWHAIAPDPDSRERPSGFDATNPAAYPAAGWAAYDAAVRAAAARGIGIYFVLTGDAPLWATSPPARGITTHNPEVYEPSAAQFGQFVEAVGKRYDGSYTPPGSTSPLPAVRFWGIWNEPNYGYDLQPQAIGGVEVSPKLYRGLLDDAWSALHGTGHGGDTILIGETAPRGADVPGVANGMVPLRFLRGLYCVDSSYQQLRGAAASALGCPATAAASQRFRAANPALFDATGFADHAYPLGQVAPPNVPAPSSEPDWAGLADIAKLEGTLDRLNEVYGSHTQLPIYNTEFGFQTDPPQSECGCVFLSPATAARYLNWSEFIEFGNPRLRSYAQYLLYDAPGPPGHVISESDFSSGLMTVNGIAKPGYSAFRLPIYLPVTSTRPGRSLEVWGDVRPAAFAKHDTGSSQRAAIQFKPSSGGAFTTLASVTITNPAGYFEVPVKFPSSGSVRLEWTYPHGFAFLPPMTPRTVTSREQAITIS